MKLPRQTCRTVGAVVLVLLWAQPGRGQKAPVPGQPNPQAPVLDMPGPVGMQRGTTLELTLSGSNLAGPTGLWTSFPAVITIPKEQANGKEEKTLRVRITVPNDAPLGFHWLRLATTRGISNTRLFCIDDLPQLLAVDTNRSRTTPQALATPCVVAGRAAAESSSWFKVTAQSGERLTFEVLGHRLGSTFDPRLALYDIAGHELAADDDAPGCQADPRLTYTFRSAGDYLLELRDTMWRGGADYWYRLRVGDFPCATTPIPMAARRGSTVTVRFAGPNVEGVAPIEVKVPNDPDKTSMWVAPQGANGLSGWPVGLLITDMEELVEQEPNDQPARANRIPVPAGVTGRFHKKGDVDHFVFDARKGQRLIVEGHTTEFGSPTLLYLVLRDAKAAEVARSNPQTAPPLDQRIDFTPPADGAYTLEVQNLLGTGGPSESYRVTVTPYRPGFGLTLALDRCDLPPGAATALPVQVARRDYGGAIAITVSGSHPGVTGHLTIPAGSAAPPNQPPPLLFITAAAEVPPGPYTLRVRGQATIDGQKVIEEASVRAVVSQNLGGLPFPPRQLVGEVGLAIAVPAPITLSARTERPDAVRGTSVPIVVHARRDKSGDGEIALTAVGLPPNVTATLKNIPKGQDEVTVQLTAAPNVPLGSFEFAVTGKVTAQGKEVFVMCIPARITLVLPFELEAAPVAVAPGGKAILRVKAVRKGGYAGPIKLEVRNLPAGLTASAATIAEGQAGVDVEFAATPAAAATDKGDVNVLGTATAAGNQQNASANFKVSVAAK